MELVGLPSSRNRPPTRDVRDLFREKARQMLIDCGVPNVLPRLSNQRIDRIGP
jgi:hypothetical protein